MKHSFSLRLMLLAALYILLPSPDEGSETFTSLQRSTLQLRDQSSLIVKRSQGENQAQQAYAVDGSQKNVQRTSDKLMASIGSATSSKHVLSLVRPHLDVMTYNHAVWAMERMASLRDVTTKQVVQSSAFSDLLVFLEYHAYLMDPWNLSNSAKSLAKLKQVREFDCNDVVHLIAFHSKASIHLFHVGTLLTLSWSFGTLKKRDEALFESIADRALQLLELLSAEQVNCLAWAFAEVGYAHPVLMEALATRAMTQLDQFKLLDIANFVQCYAKLGLPNPSLMWAVTDHVVCEWTSLKHQNEQKMIWHHSTILVSAAKASVKNEELIALYQKEFSNKLYTSKATNHGIAAVLWSLQRLGCKTSHPKLTQAFIAAFVARKLPPASLGWSELVDAAAWNRRLHAENNRTV